jgi:hypothetical protein
MPPTPQASALLPLQYATVPSPWPKRIRRLLLALVLAAMAFVGWRWGPYAWHQSLLLYWQRQCMNYAMPRDAIAYEEEPTAAAQLLKSPEYSPYPLRRSPGYKLPATPVQAAALVPPCWRSLTTLAKPPTGSFFFPGSPSARAASAIIFLHERVSPVGHHRLVCVTYGPDTDTFQPAFIMGYDYVASVASPASWVRPISPPLIYFGPFDVRSTWQKHPPLVRVYAGQPDPADPAHFTVRYQMWGQEDVLDGRLQDDDHVSLMPRHLPDWPRN